MKNFIGLTQIENTLVIDDLIDYYHASENKYEGIIYNELGIKIVDKNIKESTNVDFPPNSTENCFRNYIKELQKSVDDYISNFQWCNKGSPWTIVEHTTIQKYGPGGGFKDWHYERFNASDPIVRRHLVFMTYLNDVSDHGETEFYYQELLLKPKKGLTVIWPADWTYTHRGVPSPTQDKYIITGWLNLFNR
jgi:hypothetical protein